MNAESLERTQGWFQAVIIDPDGVEAGIESEPAREYHDIAADQLEKILTRSNRLSAADRLSVYHNAYFSRLIDCLREEFPVFRRAVGEEIFDGFALDYLIAHPSRSYTLSDFGATFAAYLAQSCPNEEAAEGEPSASWPEFLIDLATLERTINDIFDGPGLETERPLDAAELAKIPLSSWLDARLVAAPSLKLCTLRFPLHDYYRAARREEEVPLPEPRLTHLALHRRDYVVQLNELLPTEFALLEGIVGGSTIGEAMELAIQTFQGEPEELAPLIQKWFRRWTTEGFFQGIEPLGA